MKFTAHLTALLLLPPYAFAGEPALQPTTVNVGECVPPTISTARTAFQDRLDKADCDARNSDDERKSKACLQHSRWKKTLPFFAADCNGEDSVLISLNGIEHKLRLADPVLAQHDTLDGRYQGDGLEAEVTSGKIIRQTHDADTPNGKGQVLNEWVHVTVTVTHDGKVQKIRGVARYGP